MRRAFSAQNVGLRCGGDQRRCPEFTSAAYSSKVVWVLVYSSSMELRLLTSSMRSTSVRWRPLRFWRRAGRRARTAAGSNVCSLVERRLYKVDTSSRVVFSLGDNRNNCVYRGITLNSLSLS